MDFPPFELLHWFEGTEGKDFVNISKSEILDHVWDGRFDGDPNIVEVYVGHLRNKLDRPYGRASIETVRGAGYRLETDGG